MLFTAHKVVFMMKTIQNFYSHSKQIHFKLWCYFYQAKCCIFMWNERTSLFMVWIFNCTIPVYTYHSDCHTRSDDKVHELATMCLPWQQGTETVVWFDDIGISAFRSCVVDLWQSLSGIYYCLSVFWRAITRMSELELEHCL
jgi:hypothetical protein